MQSTTDTERRPLQKGERALLRWRCHRALELRKLLVYITGLSVLLCRAKLNALSLTQAERLCKHPLLHEGCNVLCAAVFDCYTRS